MYDIAKNFKEMHGCRNEVDVASYHHSRLDAYQVHYDSPLNRELETYGKALAHRSGSWFEDYLARRARTINNAEGYTNFVRAMTWPLPTNSLCNQAWQELSIAFSAKDKEINRPNDKLATVCPTISNRQKLFIDRYKTSPSDLAVIMPPGLGANDWNVQLFSISRVIAIEYNRSNIKRALLTFDKEGQEVFMFISSVPGEGYKFLDEQFEFLRDIAQNHQPPATGFAWHLSSKLMNNKQKVARTNEVGIAAGEIEKFLTAEVTANTQTEAGNLIRTKYVKQKGCDYRSGNRYCKSGILFYKTTESVDGTNQDVEHAVPDSLNNFEPQKCPICNPTHGYGRTVEIDAEQTSSFDNLLPAKDAFNFISPDPNFLSYTDKAVEDTRLRAFYSIVGIESNSNPSDSGANVTFQNETGVKASLKTREIVIKQLAKNFERLFTAIDTSLYVVCGGSPNNAVVYDFGDEFYLHSLDGYVAQLEQAKLSDNANAISAISRRLLNYTLRKDPVAQDRANLVETIKELFWPYRNLTVQDRINLYTAGIIDKATLSLSLNFDTVLRLYEAKISSQSITRQDLDEFPLKSIFSAKRRDSMIFTESDISKLKAGLLKIADGLTIKNNEQDSQ